MISSYIQYRIIFIYIMLFQGCVAEIKCNNTHPATLFKALGSFFDITEVRPVSNYSTPTVVNVSFTLVGILGVNEKAQTVTTFLWHSRRWDIENLSWDPESCGTKRLSVPREKLWVPDIFIFEFMDEDKSPVTPYVYIDHNGHVYDAKPVRVISSCRLEIYTFPFDVQNCTLTFGSYLHTGNDIIVKMYTDPETVLNNSKVVIQTNGEWELVNILGREITLNLLGEEYNQMRYHIIMRRRPMLYVVNLLIPSCFLITLDLFSFLLPPQSVDRSAFKMTLILGYTVFLLIMNDLLPTTGETTPLINVFFSISLALMVASLLETILITNIQCSANQYPAVPRWLSILILQYLARLVCLQPKPPSNRVTVILNEAAQGKKREMTLRVEHPEPTITFPAEPKKFIDGPLTVISPPVDPVLLELKSLVRDLTAIRAQMDKEQQGSQNSEEWNQIGLVVDRLLFGLYLLFITVSFIAVICFWHLHNHDDHDHDHAHIAPATETGHT